MQQQNKSATNQVQGPPKNNPYWHLLQPILLQLPTIFSTTAEPQPKVPPTEYNLKIYITQSEDQKLNNFIYTYSMPTSLQKFIAMNQDLNLQKKLDVNIGAYEVKEKLSDDCWLMYLAYKKVLLISARDFIYVRYRVVDLEKNEYWVVSTSIPDQDQYPGVIRGTIIKSALKAVQKQPGILQVSVYSLVDMKMQLKPQATKSKGVIQIKKYVEKCYEHLFGKKPTSNTSTKQIQKQQEAQ